MNFDNQYIEVDDTENIGLHTSLEISSLSEHEIPGLAAAIFTSGAFIDYSFSICKHWSKLTL